MLSVSDIQTKIGSWMQIMKGLPYEGGPSTTKFVYFATAGLVGVVILSLTGVSAWTFHKTGHIDGNMAWLIGSTTGSLLAATSITKTQHQKHESDCNAPDGPPDGAPKPPAPSSENEKG